MGINQTICAQVISDDLLYLASSVLLAVVLLFSSYVFFKAFQQRGYHATGYLNWLAKSKQRYSFRLLNVCVFALVTYLVFSALFAKFNIKWLSLVGLLFGVIFLIIFQKSSTNKTERQHLALTFRMKRLYAASFVLVTAFLYGLFFLSSVIEKADVSEVFKYFRYAAITLMPLAMPFFILLANVVMHPYEALVRHSFEKKARKKFYENNEKTIVVGITGSYGKTSVKNILAVILSEKYSVLATPESYNTPMGLSKTVLDGYSGQQVFIAEMGARRRGDIKHLCEMFTPDISVITSVSRQHLESFKSYDNIVATKYEIVENKKKSGFSVFSSDNDGSKLLYEKCKSEKYIAGKIEGDLTASFVSVSGEGSLFKLMYGEKQTSVSTVLLGEHNVSNILTASLVALKMGLTPEEVARGISKIVAVPHRLQLICGNGVTVIDDSYNASPQSVKAALAVLRLFDNRKIVVTSGLIELYNLEDYENKCLGENLAKSADKVILIGSKKTDKILEGLKMQGYSEDNVYVADGFDEAMKTLGEIQLQNDVILFLNDLPDTFVS